jgi:proline iminopeptidase
MSQTTYNLYPELEPYDSGWLNVSAFHRIYYEQCGNPKGYPVVFLHGGPGSGCNPTQRRFFDAKHYRIILLDQRGCGRSLPLGETLENETDNLVEDLEKLRTLLGIDQWIVFGGSWGSSLALAYAVAHPEHVSGLILRGIFLSRQKELDWFLGESQSFYPEAWGRLSSYLPHEERSDVLQAYANRIFSEDRAINIPAAIEWNTYEGNIMTLRPSESTATVPDDIQLARARVQIHYILHKCFIGQRDILDEVTKLASIPTVIVQGRYDMVCPPITAWELKQAMPHAEFVMVPDAGHSAMEPGTTSALVAATEKFKSLFTRP